MVAAAGSPQKTPLSCSGLCRALATQLSVLPRSEVTFLAPVTRPDKVVCVGMNYADHCREQNVPVPKEPIIFSKFASAIVGPYDNIILPPESQVGARPPVPHPESLGPSQVLSVQPEGTTCCSVAH